MGFRWFVHREAAALGIRGSVCNTDRGEVEVIAAGSAAALDKLRHELTKGPRGSRVDGLFEQQLDDSEATNLGPFVIEGAW